MWQDDMVSVVHFIGNDFTHQLILSHLIRSMSWLEKIVRCVGCFRASEGLLGVDYFFPGYAVWAGMIEAAADLGYDTNNLVSAPRQSPW